MRRWLLGAALAVGCRSEGDPAPKVERAASPAGDEVAPSPEAGAAPDPAPAPIQKVCRVEALPEEGKLVHVEPLGIQLSLPPLDWTIDCDRPALAEVRMEQFGILVRAEHRTTPDPATAVAEGLDAIVAAWSQGGSFEPGPRELGTGADGRSRACVSGPGELDGAPHHMQTCATGLPAAKGTTVVYVGVFVREAAWDPAAEDAKMLLELADAIATDWKPESG